MRKILVILVLGLFVGGVEAQASEYCRQEKTEEPRDPGKGKPVYAKGVNAQGYARGMSDKEFEILKKKQHAHRLLSKECFRFIESEFQDLYDQGRYEDMLLFAQIFAKASGEYRCAYSGSLENFMKHKNLCLEPDISVSFLRKILDGNLWSFPPRDLSLKYCSTYLNFFEKSCDRSFWFKNLSKEIIQGLLQVVDKRPWLPLRSMTFEDYRFNASDTPMSLSDLKSVLLNPETKWQGSVELLEISQEVSYTEFFRKEKEENEIDRLVRMALGEPKPKKEFDKVSRLTGKDLREILERFPSLRKLEFVTVFSDFEGPFKEHYGIEEIELLGSDVSILGLMELQAALRRRRFPNFKSLTVWNARNLGDGAFDQLLEMQCEFPEIDFNCFGICNGMTKKGFKRYKEGLKRNGLKKRPYFSNFY